MNIYFAGNLQGEIARLEMCVRVGMTRKLISYAAILPPDAEKKTFFG